MKRSFSTTQFIIMLNSLVLILGFAALMFLNKRQLKEIAIDQHAQSMKIFSSVVERMILQNADFHNVDLSEFEDDVNALNSERLHLGDSTSSNSKKSLDAIVKNLADGNLQFRISVIGADGKLVADSLADISTSENHLNREEVNHALAGSEDIAIRESVTSGGEEIYFATPITLGGKNCALRLSSPIDSNIFFSGNYLFKMIFGTVIILIPILFFSILISAHIVIGIDELKNAARHYQIQDFEFRSSVHSPKELSELSSTMNAMAKRIGQNIERMKELERMRKDFVANVSHELKTPITSIKGFAETLLDGALEDAESARSFASIIKTQSDRMENVIEDLLSLSELESGSAKIEFEDVDVVSFVENLCEEYRVIAKAKNISIHFSSSLSSCVKKINPNLFRQCCSNILDNAIKYCPENSRVEVEIVRVSVSNDFAASTEPNERIRIAIEDNGMGIPDKYADRIFERFFRVDKGRSRESGGTGLGLSIAKHIVEIHGGKIRESKSEKFSSGARFEIEI